MWLENEPVYQEQPLNTTTWCKHFVNCLALPPFLLHPLHLKAHVKRSNYILTLHINVHHCRCLSTSVVCGALVFSSLSSVDVSDVQWVFLDMFTSLEICPHNSWIRNACSYITVHFHSVTFCDNFIFNLLYRCWV